MRDDPETGNAGHGWGTQKLFRSQSYRSDRFFSSVWTSQSLFVALYETSNRYTFQVRYKAPPEIADALRNQYIRETLLPKSLSLINSMFGDSVQTFHSIMTFLKSLMRKEKYTILKAEREEVVLEITIEGTVNLYVFPTNSHEISTLIVSDSSLKNCLGIASERQRLHFQWACCLVPRPTALSGHRQSISPGKGEVR